MASSCPTSTRQDSSKQDDTGSTGGSPHQLTGLISKKPVYVGDVVRFITVTNKTGNSSVVVDVKVEAERFDTGDHVVVTEAQLTMVSVDASGTAIPFDGPPTVEVQDSTS